MNFCSEPLPYQPPGKVCLFSPVIQILFSSTWIFAILNPVRCNFRNGQEPDGLGKTGNQQALETRTLGKNFNWFAESEKESLEIAVITDFPMRYGCPLRNCKEISVIKFRGFLENEGDFHPPASLLPTPPPQGMSIDFFSPLLLS